MNIYVSVKTAFFFNIWKYLEYKALDDQGLGDTYEL